MILKIDSTAVIERLRRSRALLGQPLPGTTWNQALRCQCPGISYRLILRRGRRLQNLPPQATAEASTVGRWRLDENPKDRVWPQQSQRVEELGGTGSTNRAAAVLSDADGCRLMH